MGQTTYKSTNEYPSVLTPKDIQHFLGIGERQVYELLNKNQFHTVRVGRMIKVSKDVFLKWIEG